MRTWLNDTFFNRAFTIEEQNGILTTLVDNSQSQCNPGFCKNGGNNTEDKVFLLSYAELFKYFKNNNSRKHLPTEYALTQGSYTRDETNEEGKLTTVSWLRSPG